MLAILALAAALTSAQQAPPAALIAALPDCKDQLSIGLDAENGAFDGMSHAGVLLVVRNIGPTACKMAALPSLTFQDATGHSLTIARKTPPGMHPGPVVLPLGLAAGAEATTALRFVSGDVYDGHHCLTPATLTFPTASVPSTLAWSWRLCGPPSTLINFEQPLLQLDPILTVGKPD